MAEWNKITSRGSVEDRRGAGNTAKVGGGVGIVGLVLYLVINYMGGGSINDALPQLELLAVAQQQPINQNDFEGADHYEVFAATVLGSANDMWSGLFSRSNEVYEAPKLVLFRGGTQSGCGDAMSQSGPHYCPLDATIYLDETFFDELQRRFGGSGGDVAQAYVIAHEVGHHVQQQLGILSGAGNTDNEASIKTELQADCFAGLWAYSIKDRGIFEVGEIKEALDQASAVGDDRIQKTTTGEISPETWTHGSSADRVYWFTQGFENGTMASCNTSALETATYSSQYISSN